MKKEMKTLAYYHIACMNHWREVVTSHCRVLADAGFPHPVNISLIGSMSCWNEVLEISQAFGLNFKLRNRTEHLRSFEAPAMRLIERDCRDLGNEHASVLYWHTKAVSKPGIMNDFYWRGIMNHFTLTQWKERERALQRYDISCPFWEENGRGDHDNIAHSQGTFWWARASWIRKLSGFDWYYNDPWHSWKDSPDPEYMKRFACEFWISSNNLRGNERRVESLLKHRLHGKAECAYPKTSRILAIKSL